MSLYRSSGNDSVGLWLGIQHTRDVFCLTYSETNKGDIIPIDHHLI